MDRPVARTAVRIAADSRPVLVFTVVLTLAVALASFALSFASLRDAALWGRVPAELAFLVPVVIDASVLVYGLVALVLRARGRSSAWAWFLMCGFTVVSIGANAAHAYDVGPELRAVVGVVLVALAPLSVLTSTHALASLVVADEPAPAPEPITGKAVLGPERAQLMAPNPTEAPASEGGSSGPSSPVAAPDTIPVLAPVRSSSRPRARVSTGAKSTLPGLDFSGVTA